MARPISTNPILGKPRLLRIRVANKTYSAEEQTNIIIMNGMDQVELTVAFGDYFFDTYEVSEGW